MLFSPFFLDSLLVTVSSFNGFYYYFRITFPLCKFRGLPGSTLFSFPVMKRRKCLGMKRSSQPSSNLLPGNGPVRKHAEAESDVKLVTQNPEEFVPV